MGFFHKLSKGFHKFGQKLNKGLHQVHKIGEKAVHFVERKALPIAHKISHIGAKALQYATPVIGSVAPEALPFLIAGQKGLSAIDKATGAVEKGLKIGKSASRTIDKFRSGDVAGGIQEAKATGQQANELRKNPFKK